MKRTAIIMAGGAGERFWPLSRINKPKQLLKLLSDKTLIEEAIDRIEQLILPEDIFIITGEHLLDPMREILTLIPEENIIAEPYKRNTAPCLALGAAIIAEKYKSEYSPAEISIAVLTADQLIRPEDEFVKTVECALQVVENNNSIAIIGIPPNRPETGYGYIEIDKPFQSGEFYTSKKVSRFHEKPNYEKALEYIKSGHFLWNSGMFFWRLDVFMNKIIEYCPEIGGQLPKICKLYEGQTEIVLAGAFKPIADIFYEFPNVSIDFALLEKADNVMVVPASFVWDDIGSWDALYRYKELDVNNNLKQGNIIINDSTNTLVINDSEKSIVTVQGVDDLILVVTDDSVLLCKKSDVQDVKKIVGKIKEEGKIQWL